MPTIEDALRVVFEGAAKRVAKKGQGATFMFALTGLGQGADGFRAIGHLRLVVGHAKDATDGAGRIAFDSLSGQGRVRYYQSPNLLDESGDGQPMNLALYSRRGLAITGSIGEVSGTSQLLLDGLIAPVGIPEQVVAATTLRRTMLGADFDAVVLMGALPAKQPPKKGFLLPGEVVNYGVILSVEIEWP